MTAAQKDSLYRGVLERLPDLLHSCPDPESAMASVAALLKESLPHFYWVGFYRVAPDGSLRVGPYQGPPACPVLAPGAGVCGEALRRRATVLVPDVQQFGGHIACDAGSRSEIVVPLLAAPGSEPLGVLDVDSDRRNAFDETDRLQLEEIAARVAQRLVP